MDVRIVSHTAGQVAGESFAAAKKKGETDEQAYVASATAVLQNAIAIVRPYLHPLPASHIMKDTHEPVVIIFD